MANLVEVEEIRNNFHDRKHTDTCGDRVGADVNILKRDLLLHLDTNEPLQKSMPLVNLVN